MALEWFVRLVMLVMLAPAGLLAGHSVTHALAAADAGPGASTLMRSGHLWWALAGGALAVVALGAGGLLQASPPQRRADVSFPTSLEPYPGLAARLAGLQLGMFVLLEVVERHAVDHSASLLLHGALAQLLLAVVLTAAVWGLAVTVERFCATATRSWSWLPIAPRPRPTGARFVRPRLPSVRPVGSRAPPLPS
jgi:hypothetical protein